MILPSLPPLEEFTEDLWGDNPRDTSFDTDNDRVSTQLDFLVDTVRASPDSGEELTHQAPPTLNASKHEWLCSMILRKRKHSVVLPEGVKTNLWIHV